MKIRERSAFDGLGNRGGDAEDYLLQDPGNNGVDYDHMKNAYPLSNNMGREGGG